MITTHFLSREDFDLFGQWLKQQDEETRSLYFGINANDLYIDNLINSIKANIDKHHILVATNLEQWVGTLHIVEIDDGEQAEFGVLVHPAYRGQKLGDKLMDEGITWVRNRGFSRLYLHCLSWNHPIKKLCKKHGLHMKNHGGDTDAEIDVPPASFMSIGKEIRANQKNIYIMWLKNSLLTFRELYG